MNHLGERRTRLSLEHYGLTGFRLHEEMEKLELELTRNSLMYTFWDMISKDNLSFERVSNHECVLRGYIMRSNEPIWGLYLNRLKIDGFITRYEFFKEWTLLSLFGNTKMQPEKIIPLLCDILRQENIAMADLQVSDTLLSVSIPLAKMQDAQTVLFHTFFSEERI